MLPHARSSRAVNVHERDGKRYRDELLSDIGERKRMEQKLAHQATHDLLTGRPNRSVFEDRFRQAVARPPAERDGRAALSGSGPLQTHQRHAGASGRGHFDPIRGRAAGRLSARVRDAFAQRRRPVYAGLGDVGAPEDAVHVAERILVTLSPPFSVKGNEVFLAGDTLIQFAAERLAGCLRESETLSRSGGDRFTLVLGDVGAPEDAVHVAERILETLSPPFSVKGNEVFLGASIGIALYPQDGVDLPALQRAADSALYAAKRQGGRIRLSNPEISQEANRRLGVETELHHALERDEISVHYQPQFDLATGRVAGLEALVRWDNPKFGRVPPSVLIPIAEESGLIVPIGARVLHGAGRQGMLWRDAGYGPMQGAVNTSAVQFARSGLAETVAATLAETGLRRRA